MVFSRYNASEKNSGVVNGILKNKLGFTDQTQLDTAESLRLELIYEYFLQTLRQGEIEINLSLLFDIHYKFFYKIYDWAGKIRTVDISKGDTFFAPSQYINNALEDFKTVLKNNLPNRADSKKSLAQKLAIIHCKFNAIHPFREGNGRTIRLFLDLIAAQAGYDFIDYSKSPLKEFVQACKDGMRMEYGRMEKIMYKGLKKK